MYSSGSTILLLASFFSPIASRAAAVPTSVPENDPDTIYFHDSAGKVVSRRAYTSLELDLRANQSTTPDLRARISQPALPGQLQLTIIPETRSNQDILFWLSTSYPCGTTTGTCPAYQNIVVETTMQRSCSSPSVTSNTEIDKIRTACHRSVMVDAQTWYYIDKCDESLDWYDVAPGSYMGDLLTWENKHVGRCWGTEHSRAEELGCGGTGRQVWRTLVRCTVG